jgi:hypothetical protein
MHVKSTVIVLLLSALASCGKVGARPAEDGGPDAPDAPSGASDGGPPADVPPETVQPFPSNGSEGVFAPTADVVISPGIHQYSTINIPMGVTVTVSGTGVLELRAQGAIRIAGTVNLSGADGRIAVGVFGSGGGGTGTPSVRGMDGASGVCPTGGPGGTGVAGRQVGNGTCGEALGSPGGQFGGGAGAAYRGSGGGGGGYAGGAGGGTSLSAGGAGASMNGVGGASSTQPGAGGQADGGSYAGAVGGSNTPGATGGGGGSIGRAAIDDLAVASTFQPGSGGGGGAGRTTAPNIPPVDLIVGGSGGGGGGGALRIASPVSIDIASTGVLRADGGAGGSTNDLPAGGGGGGSGGVVFLSAPVMHVAGTVSSVGGAGGGPSAPGGAGGRGRIRISVTEASCALTGTFSPPLSAGCGASVGIGTPDFAFVGAFPN